MTKYFTCTGCSLKVHKLSKSFKLHCSSMNLSLSQRYCQLRVCDGDFDKDLNWTKAWSALWGIREPCWIFILLKIKWNSHSHFMCNLARIIGGKMKRMYSWESSNTNIWYSKDKEGCVSIGSLDFLGTLFFSFCK